MSGDGAAIEERLKRLNEVARAANHPNTRPRDAATLIVIDRTDASDWRVLMGRRHMRHRFMPGAWVFPGGGVEPGDHRLSLSADLSPDDMALLRLRVPARRPATLPRALGVAALRETFEEVGLPLDLTLDGERSPTSADLSRLRFIARAVTPPRRPKRFDTRFLALLAGPEDLAAACNLTLSGELEEVAWLTRAAMETLPLPAITRAILDELSVRLAADPSLAKSSDIPLYQWRGARFCREMLSITSP